jgi:hypothetical protein
MAKIGFESRRKGERLEQEEVCIWPGYRLDRSSIGLGDSLDRACVGFESRRKGRSLDIAWIGLR